MRVVALVSGGKDSCYSMQLCKQHGHDIVALANLLPEESAPDELDSFCFQTVGHQLIGAYAACMGIPLFRKRISGTSSVQDLGYSPTEGDEVEDLYQLLAYVKECIPSVQGVASGAIASDYQRLRVENVCSRLNLVSLAYLWHQPQRLLLRGMVESGVEAILVKVACLGLHPRKHLGRTITAMEPTLLSLADAYGCNVCGEGGEYETLTLDCPMFTRARIELEESEIVYGTSDVGHLVPKAFRIVPKSGVAEHDLHSDVRFVPGDYVPVPRSSRCSASQLPLLSPTTAAGNPASGFGSGTNAVAAAAGGGGGGSSSVVAACSVDPLLQPAAPSSFHVHVSICGGPDYVQLVCRAVRPKSALPSDLTECDTTAALHALLTTAEQELASFRMDLHHCLFVHLFLVNMGHFQAANRVYCNYFPSRDPPSRACVQVCLPHDCPVMCEFLLARGAAPPVTAPRSPLPSGLLPPPSLVTRHTRRVLHVQSISSWAPSCIGPYSQASSYRGLVYMAGVIPLDPPVMTLVPGDITAQVLRAMLSCEAVAVAQRTTVVGAALGLTVYLAAAVGSSVVAGGPAGGGSGASGERGTSFSSGGGAELRALTRAAVEAILEHGLPGYPQVQHRHSSFGQSSVGTTTPGAGGSGRYHRSSTCEPGIGTPRSSHGTWPGTASYGRASAPPSRRTVMLGADGLDEEEEEEEAERASAAGAAGGPSGALLGGRPISYGQVYASPSVLDPYLQPPEVRVPIRPSVLYVVVPSLPRGSLVEIQPVCLDVEALSVIRKLTGHDSFVKRRNNSHHDTTALNQSSHSQHHGTTTTTTNNNNNGTNTNNFCSHNHHHPGISLPQPSAAAAVIYTGPAGGGSATAAFGTITSWSELPPTPRASLESLAGRDGAGSGSHGNSLQFPYGSGSSPMQWQVSSDLLGVGAMGSPLPFHMLSAAGFMSPEAGGSLAGTPSIGPHVLTRQRSSFIGPLAIGGGGNAGTYTSGAGGAWPGGSCSGLFHRCLSPGPQPAPSGSSMYAQGGLPWTQGGLSPQQAGGASAAGGPHAPPLQMPPQPQLSAPNSSHQLLSPTLQHLLQLQSSPQLPQPLMQLQQQVTNDESPLQQMQPMARSALGGTGSRRQRLSSSNGGAATNSSKDVLTASVTGARTSYSGSSSSHSGPLGQCNSLDGNILSFEVSSGRGGPPLVVSPLSHGGLHGANAASLLEAAPALSVTAATALATGGNHGLANSGRANRPTAISVPQPSVGGMLIQRSPFESAISTATGAAGADASLEAAPVIATGLPAGGRLSPSLCGAATSAMAKPLPARIPPVVSIPPQSSGSGSDTAPTPAHNVTAGAALVPEAPAVTPAIVSSTRSGASGSSSSSSDVMVTTVCCYGQVLRSLFHLPPAVFAPGVTTAQLTRRFRRAAGSVLAAHGMDMSCLIWVRVWYERGSVEFTDDEYSTNSSIPHGGAAAAGGPGSHPGVSAVPMPGAFGMAGFIPGGGPRVLHAMEDDSEDNSGSGRRGRCLRRASGSGDCSNGGGEHAPNHATAAATGLGSASSGCASPQPSAAARLIAVAEAAATGPAGSGAGGGSGSGSPRCCPNSPAAAAASPSAHHRRLSGMQTDAAIPDDKQAQQTHDHHHSHHHHNHGHFHHNHSHQQHSSKDLPLNGQVQQQHFHVSWVPVQRVATNASPQPTQCVAVLELLAALPTP